LNMLKYKSSLAKPEKNLNRSSVWAYIFCAPFIIGYFLFSLFPIMYSFFISFFDWNGVGDKLFVGVKNYITIFTRDPLFYKSLTNTLLIMLMSTPVEIILGMLLAVVLFNMKKGKSFFQTANFLPYITTPVAIGFIFAYLFDWNNGYVNLVLIKIGILHEGIYWLQEPATARMVVALMIIWKYLGYFMTIYLAGMTSIPEEIYEAAKVDGANPFKTFIKITLPLLKNITAFLLVTSVIGGLQMFDEPSLLYSWGERSYVGGPDNSVLTVVWKFYNDAFKSDSMLGYGSAISFSLFAIIIVFSFISYRISAGKEV